uniref:Variant surface glycoprotein 1125.1498 n=1 Tax=Trypanosoma brucei TaxID=5691 RepID=A0A1J0R7B8_9TRYP|nr:variant surface glycoprotein 1125.1498 [Trypanosoma brucei]
MLDVVTAVVILLMRSGATLRAAAAGENVKEFRDMCHFYNLLTQQIPNPQLTADEGKTATPIAQATNDIMAKITALNITTLPRNIEAFLEETKEPKTGADLRKQEPGKTFFGGATDEILDVILSQYWAQQKGTEAEQFKKRFSIPLSEATKASLRIPIQDLEHKAAAIATSIKNKVGQISQKRQATRNAALLALYGSKTTQAATADDRDPNKPVSILAAPDHFPFASNNREAYCKPGNADALTAGDALVADLVCICSGGNSDASTNNQYCTKTPEAGLKQITTAATVKDTHGNLKNWQSSATQWKQLTRRRLPKGQ